MASNGRRAIYLGLLLVALIVAVVGADRLGLTAAVVALLMLGVGVELLLWFTLVHRNDSTPHRDC